MNDVIKRTGTFKSFDGTPIYYEVRGSGRPVFLCYGLACVMNHWTHQVKHFSNRYQTVLFDYRGHHRSGLPDNRENLTLDALCMDIKALANHLEIRHGSFWGHSLGVQILLRLYDMHPELISNMVFINGFASNPIKGLFGGIFGSDGALTAFRLFKEGYKALPGTLGYVWRRAVGNPLAIPLSALAGGFNLSLTNMKDIEVYARGVAAMDLDVFITLFDQMLNYDASPVLDRVKAPVLIISGNRDGVTPAFHQEQMHQRIKGSQLLKVPYGSHCTQLDLPDYVNMRIERYLTELDYK